MLFCQSFGKIKQHCCPIEWTESWLGSSNPPKVMGEVSARVKRWTSISGSLLYHVPSPWRKWLSYCFCFLISQISLWFLGQAYKRRDRHCTVSWGLTVSSGRSSTGSTSCSASWALLASRPRRPLPNTTLGKTAPLSGLGRALQNRSWTSSFLSKLWANVTVKEGGDGPVAEL